MKTRTTKSVLFRFSMALAVMTTILTPIPAWSAEHAHGKESMAGCPMMKGMKDMDEKSAGNHEGHKTDPK